MSTTTHERLVTPIKTFKCWCAGELIELKAGISFISRTHPVVLRFPSRFGLDREAITLDGEPVSVARSTTAKPRAWSRPAPAAPAASAGPTLYVRETSGGKPIGITRDAMAAIREAVGRWDDVETGGGLLVHRDGACPVIISADENAEDRARFSVRQDLFWITQQRRIRQRDASARIGVGAWHSHLTGSADASEKDHGVWEELLERSKDAEVFGVIALPEPRDSGGWRPAPRLAGYRISYGSRPGRGECLQVASCSVEQVQVATAPSAADGPT